MAYIRCSGNIGGSLKVRTASGNPCTFSTDLADALVSLTADIVCGQDLHGYDHPWPAGGGKNLLDVSDGNGNAMRGVTPAYDNDGGLNFTGTVSEMGWCGSWNIDITLPAGTYTFSIANPQIDHNITFALDWSGKVVIDRGSASKTVTFNAPQRLNRITLNSNSEDVGQNININVKDFQIEVGSTPSAYEPYSNICPIVGHSELKLANVDDTTAQFWSVDNGFDGVVDFNQLVYEPTIWSQNYKGFKAGTSFIQGHKILMSVGGTSSSMLYAFIYSNIGGVINNSMNVGVGNTAIFNCPFTQTQTVDEGHDTTDTVWIFIYSDNYASWQNPSINVIDLTQMLGASIADYIYSLEQGQAGAGVSFFKHFYPDEYYAYNAGETQTLVQMPFTVAFGQTVYGGVYDANRGKVRITHKLVDLGTCTWGGGSDVGGKNLFTVAIPDIKRPATTSTLPNWKLEGYELKTQSYAVNYNNVYSGLGWFDGVAFWTTDYTAAQREQLKSDMSGVHLCYELATPIVIDVPSISVFAENGTNNIVSDCIGDVDVSYLELIRGT